MSVTPQTNDPEVPGVAPSDADVAGAATPSLFARSQPVDPGSRGGNGSRNGGPRLATSADVAEADGRQLEARVVRRLVRHISPWSVLKVSVLLYLSMYLVFMLAGLALWSIAESRGLVGSVESFMDELLAEENFAIDGAQIFRISATLGIFGVAIASVLTVLFSIIFNLISDLTGGVRLSVVEMESARPRRGRSRRASRRSSRH